MLATDVLSRVQEHFANLGFAPHAQLGQPALLILESPSGHRRWVVAILGKESNGEAHLKSFETAMQSLIDYRQNLLADEQTRLGLAMPFGNAPNRHAPSYRRALKKYSNSIIFEDLDIHLILLNPAKKPKLLVPEEVNEYLRALK